MSIAGFRSREMDLYQDLMRHVQDKTEQVSRGQAISIRDTLELAREVRRDFQDLMGLLDICTGYYNAADLVVSHVVNVAFFALKMAVDMKLPGQQIEDTLVSGLLHDIGFGTVPAFGLDIDALLLVESEMERLVRDTDQAVVQGHSEAGSKAVAPETDQARRVAEIIWQHHERADGKGYPRGLKEAGQQVVSRILAITDIYEALVHPRPFRDALVPPRGIEAIVHGRPGAFSPRMLKELLRSLPPFPVGYHVRLSDGSIARVLNTNVDAPLRPDVELLADGAGEAATGQQEIRLRDCPLIFITECLPRFTAGDAAR